MRESRIWYLQPNYEDDLNGDFMVAFESEALAAVYGAQLASTRDQNQPDIFIKEAIFESWEVIEADTVYVVNGGGRGPRVFWGIFASQHRARRKVRRVKLELGNDGHCDGDDDAGGMCIFAIKVRRSIYSGAACVPKEECRLIPPPY